MQFVAKAAEVPASTPKPTLQAEEDDSGMPVWLIIVIVIGCTCFIALVVVILFFRVM